MPFQTTTTPPDPNPDVQIFFDGLLLLTPANDGCFVGVHNKSLPSPARPHVFLFMVRASGQRDPIAFFSGKLTKRLTILIDDKNAKVSKFVPATADPQDFSSSIDLKKILPASNPQPDPLHINPGVFINEGVLYAAGITSPGSALLRRSGQLDQPLDSLANPIAANISFNGRTLELKWNDGINDQTLTLPRPNTNEKYEIIISNRENPEPPVPAPGTTACGDFQDHFEVINGVNPQDRFNICFIIPKISGPDTTRVPCMSVVIDG